MQTKLSGHNKPTHKSISTPQRSSLFTHGDPVKYFFLSDSWTTGRIWEFGGLWNELAWNRKPHLQQQPLYIQENGENLWLYQAEENILMVEVKPKSAAQSTIGQVVLKRLLSAEQVVERLCQEEVFHPPNFTVDSALLSPSDLSSAEENPADGHEASSPQDNHKFLSAQKPTSVIAKLRRLAMGKSPANNVKKADVAARAVTMTTPVN